MISGHPVTNDERTVYDNMTTVSSGSQAVRPSFFTKAAFTSVRCVHSRQLHWDGDSSITTVTMVMRTKVVVIARGDRDSQHGITMGMVTRSCLLYTSPSPRDS